MTKKIFEKLQYDGLKIGDYIKDLRVRGGYSQNDVYLSCGMSTSGYSRIENNLTFPNKTTCTLIFSLFDRENLQKHLNVYDNVKIAYLEYKEKQKRDKRV